MQIATRPICKNEFSSLIEFDDIYLQKSMNEAGVPLLQLAPSLTIHELEDAYKRKDVLAWVLIDNDVVGYFWFEKKSNSLYISGIAIKKEFQGYGIVQYILKLAEEHAMKNYLSKCTLSVHPLNGPAINVYLKHNYIVVNAISSFFGLNYPDSFRLILEKALTCKIQYSDKSYEVLCNDNDGLNNAINNGYVGISLIRSDNKSNSCNKICFAKLL
jgi:ribosomal protein S18 acetylase RimI-like enzyme